MIIKNEPKYLVPSRVSFKAYADRDIIPDDKGDLFSASLLTQLFRVPAFFREFPTFLEKKYPEGVKIHCYASSIGADPYSLAISIIDNFDDKNAKKYLPITAKDISSKAISLANKRNFPLNDNERNSLSDLNNYKIEDFFIPAKNTFDSANDKKSYDTKNYFVSDKLFNNVNFEEANLFDDLENKKTFKKPVVLLFRNAWQNFNNSSRKELAEKLFNKLQPKSTVIIGEIDECDYRVDLTLQQTGFKLCSIKKYGLNGLVFEKP